MRFCSLLVNQPLHALLDFGKLIFLKRPEPLHDFGPGPILCPINLDYWGQENSGHEKDKEEKAETDEIGNELKELKLFHVP